MAGRLLMIKFIKMKKKIIFAVATGLLVVATVFNINLLQGNSAGDVSLDAIAVMAKAQSELPEVTIICGRLAGPCWSGPGRWNGERWIPCYFTGYIENFCW